MAVAQRTPARSRPAGRGRTAPQHVTVAYVRRAAPSAPTQRTATFTFDTIVASIGQTSKTFTFDTIVGSAERQAAFTFDTKVVFVGIPYRRQSPAWVGLFGYPAAQGSKTFTFDTVVQPLVRTKTFTLDTIVASLTSQLKTFTLDTIVAPLTNISQFTFDTVVVAISGAAPTMIVHPYLDEGTVVNAYRRHEWRGSESAKYNAGPGPVVEVSAVDSQRLVLFSTLTPGEYVAYSPAFPERRVYFKVTE